MSAQPHLHVVPAAPDTITPRWKVRADREADRRHRALVLLEELHRETPWYAVRARHTLHKAIVAHIGTGWLA